MFVSVDRKMEELLGKYFSGEASQEEARTVLEWRSASEENAHAYFETRKVWLASDPVAPPDPVLISSILNEEDEQEVRVVPLWNQSLFKVAVAALLVIGFLFVIIQVSKQQPYGEVMTQVTDFHLPDGSDVTLQRGASITLDDFEDVRTVYLKGKAFFDVKRDEKKPFRVVTEGASIEVLGTSFVVESHAESGYTEVMVTSGVVSLSPNTEGFKKGSMKVQLKEGEMGQLSVGESDIRKKRISDDNYLSWKTKILTFRKTALEDVSEKLNDVYGVDLEFDNQTLSQCNLSARFNEKDPEEIVDIIARTFGLTYRKSGGKFVLSGEGCR